MHTREIGNPIKTNPTFKTNHSGPPYPGVNKHLLLLGLMILAVVISGCANVTQKVGMGVFYPSLPKAPVWKSSYTPYRPSSCPPLPTPNDPNTGQAGAETLTGSIPWPPPPIGANPENYLSYAHTPITTPPERPVNWNTTSGHKYLKLTSARSNNPLLYKNPQELCGVRGNSVDLAWQTTTGWPTTLIGITDSGIEWCKPGIVEKLYINTAALPLPEDAQGLTKPQLEAQGVKFLDSNPYDLNNSGVINAAQYVNDPRVSKPYFCETTAGVNMISPMDLINTFGTAGSPYYYAHQGPPGFTEAISGWNFINNNNNPYDVVHYDHGTGEAMDSSGAANTIPHNSSNLLSSYLGACPNCMVLPVRVGDSFITSANLFAEGVLFAVDSGANVIQEALGTYDITNASRQAVSYAEAHGVPIMASAADEEAQHHNLPALLAHTIVVNSVTWPGGIPPYIGKPPMSPPSYLYLNGCTNYGANIAVSVESASCSSEATGISSGIVGLAESAALQAMSKGNLKPYPGIKTVAGKPVALSVNEIRQLVTMSANDINFQTSAGKYGPADNYTVTGAPMPTTRYHTKPGFDIYTGYGRINAARLVSWIAQGKIPPQAQINSPSWFETFSPGETLVVNGIVGTTRAKSWRYQVDAGVGPDPSTWHLVEVGHGQGVRTGVLGRISMSKIKGLFPKGYNFSGGPVGPGGTTDPNRFTFSLKVVVQDSQGMIGVSRRAEFLHADSSLLTGFPKRFTSSLDAPPTLAPIGNNGQNVLIVPTAGGTIYAMEPDGKELPGWPVYTNPLPYHALEPAFATHAVTSVPRGEIIGGVAVGDLAKSSGHNLDVIASDLAGYVYAWNQHGQMLPGFPVHTNPEFSSPAALNPNNRLLPGIFAAVALADLQGNGELDIVASAMDRHVYAWEPNGQPVPGWPVLVVDPSKVSSVDPTTNAVTFASNSNVTQGTKLMDTPAIGNLNGGSGPPDVIVGSNEEYSGQPNAYLGSTGNVLKLFGALSGAANAMVYAIYPTGSLHLGTSTAFPPGYPNPGAFLPGWPVSIADLDPGLLPDVGDGVGGSPVLAALSAHHTLQVGVMSAAGPAYVLNPNGTSFLGTTGGLPNVMAFRHHGADSNSTGLFNITMPALGMPAFAPLGGNKGITLVAPALSLGKMADVGLVAQQNPHEAQVAAWSATTGKFQPGFPQIMGDMQFIDQPIVADVGGRNKGPYVVEGSATYDLRAFNIKGEEAPGFPKFTGGWMVNSPSFGPFGNLDNQVLAAGTREGYLFVWNTPTPGGAPSGPWPREHHDLWNTNNLMTLTTATSSTAKPAVSTRKHNGG
ncbi:MAG: S8 family serine peptidase [Actinobacteria bacterium]|nr:S8 family serine peptidase [Actinomycetota bacterium]MCL6105115.1 S8 family serine peptidase [Actinomycetota bacterium]